jgi:putative hydrolase of the HAD superfamily
VIESWCALIPTKRTYLCRVPVVRRVLVLLVAGALLAACRVDADVDVMVDDDGSGTVSVTVVFDADAAARIPDLDGELRTEDLVAAGWTVTGPTEQSDGAVEVRATKPFASREQLPTVLSEVSGAFTMVRLDRERSFGELRWTFDGLVDFTGGAEQFGDDQLATLLGGRPLGRDVATLEQEIGATLADSTGLTLRVTLPGDTAQQWSFRLDDTAPATLHLESTIERDAAETWAIAAAAAGALFVVVMLGAFLFRVRRRRAHARETVMDVVVEAPGSPAPPRRRLQLVVTAAHGVLWESHEQAERWLLRLAVMQGVTPTAERVRALRREVMLGRMSTGDFWAALGVPGDPAELDGAFVARFSLDPSVVDFVTTLARRGIGAACVTNDAVEWSTLLRSRFGLDRLLRPWVVSAEVGATKPAAAPYEEVARRAGIPLANCLYVDQHVENADAARTLGMSTVLIGSATAAAARAGGHGHAVNLADLFAGRGTASAR